MLDPSAAISQDCMGPDPTERSSSVTIVVRGTDDYQAVGKVLEREIQQDCEAFAEDEARREALKTCQHRGGNLKSVSLSSLMGQLIQTFGSHVQIVNKKCELEVVVIFHCAMTDQLPPQMDALNRRVPPLWDSKIKRSKHTYSSRIELVAPAGPAGEAPVEIPPDTPADTPAEVPADTPPDAPSDVPAEVPADLPTDTPPTD